MAGVRGFRPSNDVKDRWSSWWHAPVVNRATFLPIANDAKTGTPVFAVPQFAVDVGQSLARVLMHGGRSDTSYDDAGVPVSGKGALHSLDGLNVAGLAPFGTMALGAARGAIPRGAIGAGPGWPRMFDAEAARKLAEQYDAGASIAGLARSTGASQKSVRGAVTAHTEIRPRETVSLTPEIRTFIEKNYPHMGEVELAEKIGIGLRTLRRFLDDDRLNISRRSTTRSISSLTAENRLMTIGPENLANAVRERRLMSVADELGVKSDTLRRFLERQGYGPNPRTDNSARNSKMLELFNKGHTYSEIAAAFGVSKNTIAGVIDRNRGKGVAVNAPTGALSFLV